MRLRLKDVVKDLALQGRVKINDIVVKEYIELLLDPGFEFPPITVFKVGGKYLLADGYHRRKAYKLAGRDKIPVEVKSGDYKDALEYSWSANSEHGLRRTNLDKKLVVKHALMSEHSSKWSDNQISKVCRVSNSFVSRFRSYLIKEGIIKDGDKKALKNGKEIKSASGRPKLVSNTKYHKGLRSLYEYLSQVYRDMKKDVVLVDTGFKDIVKRLQTKIEEIRTLSKEVKS